MLNEQQRMEVKTAYRDAKAKPEQIRILAQLYSTTTCEIRHVLYDAGVYPIDAEVIRRIDLYLNKKGASFGTIRNWIHIMSDYGATDVLELLADWNTHPWGVDKFIVSVPLEQHGRRVKVAMTNPDVPLKPIEQPKQEERDTEKKQEEPKREPIIVKAVEKAPEKPAQQEHVNKPMDDATRYVVAAIKERIDTLTAKQQELSKALADVTQEITALHGYMRTM